MVELDISRATVFRDYAIKEKIAGVIQKEEKMWAQIGDWLYQNAMAIFISAIASLLISENIMIK